MKVDVSLVCIVIVGFGTIEPKDASEDVVRVFIHAGRDIRGVEPGDLATDENGIFRGLVTDFIGDDKFADWGFAGARFAPDAGSTARNRAGIEESVVSVKIENLLG